MPDSIILLQGENMELGTLFGVYINEVKDNYKTVQASSIIESGEKVEKKNVKISLFNLIDVKDIEVNGQSVESGISVCAIAFEIIGKRCAW